MQNSNRKYDNSFNLNNFFGFNENDLDSSLWEKSTILNETYALPEFQPHKPYRLALYVKPIEHKRLHRTRASALIRNTIVKHLKNEKNERNNSTPRSENKELKRTNRGNKKVNIMLFDENVKPENDLKRAKKTPEKTEFDKNVTLEAPSLRKNVLKEINTKSLTKTKQSKVRRSYVRKFKEKEESENVPEPPSEEIIRELEFKKLSRIKPKRAVKEEQEFEKWANNMNSAFDDVDKFELSISYD